MSSLIENLNKISNSVLQFRYEAETYKKEINEIFNSATMSISKLLSDCSFEKKDTDIEFLESIMLCQSKEEIDEYINHNPNWWRICPIVLTSEYNSHKFWFWEYRIYFFECIEKKFPVSKIEILLKTFLSNYDYLRSCKSYSKIVKSILKISKEYDLQKKRWPVAFIRDFVPSLILFQPNFKGIFQKFIRNNISLPEYIKNNNYPVDAFYWDFFNDYAFLSMNNVGLLQNKAKDRTIIEWLTFERKQNISDKRTILANAVQVIFYTKNDEELLQEIITGLYMYKNHNQWLSSVGFQGTSKKLIDKANSNIVQYVNMKAFNSFFELIQFNDSRRSFWKFYIKNFDSIKMFLPRRNYNKVRKSIPYFSGIVQHKLKESILIMKYQNYLFVEIGEKNNALYIYHESHPYFNRIWSDSFIPETIDDFKDTSLAMKLGTGFFASKSYRYYHRQYWQRSLAVWLREELRLRESGGLYYEV